MPAHLLHLTSLAFGLLALVAAAVAVAVPTRRRRRWSAVTFALALCDAATQAGARYLGPPATGGRLATLAAMLAFAAPAARWALAALEQA